MECQSGIIVGEGKAYLDTAGALGDGERIGVMAKTAHAMEIVRGDGSA